jgi:hypothetical protein
MRDAGFDGAENLGGHAEQPGLAARSSALQFS